MLKTGDKVRVKEHLAVIVKIENDAIFVRYLNTDGEQVGHRLRVSKRDIERSEE